jgi:hypothetical protein
MPGGDAEQFTQTGRQQPQTNLVQPLAIIIFADQTV